MVVFLFRENQETCRGSCFSSDWGPQIVDYFCSMVLPRHLLGLSHLRPRSGLFSSSQQVTTILWTGLISTTLRTWIDFWKPCNRIPASQAECLCAALCELFYRNKHGIPNRNAWPSHTFLCLSYFYLHLEMSCYETSGALESYFSPTYLYNTRLICNLLNCSNGHYNVDPLMRLARLHKLTLVQGLFMLVWTRTLSTSTSRDLSLASFVVLTYYFALLASS